MQDKIPVMEIFGPTIEGEGSVIGRKTMFVRTGGCDYQCSWCDSKFTWDGSQKATMMEPFEIYSKLVASAHTDQNIYERQFNFDHVTITGGNPALIGQPMQKLIDYLHTRGIKVGIETQGSKWQDWFHIVDDLVISPKPPSSGMTTNLDILDEILLTYLKFSYNASLKIVVYDKEDYAFAKILHKRYPGIPFFLSQCNPDTDSRDNMYLRSMLIGRLKGLVDTVLSDPEMNNVKVLPQLHVLLWGNKRGV